MDLSIYSLEDLLLAALKSEMDSQKVYSDLSEKVKNAFLKDKLKFLASEEVKHRNFVESMFKDKFPGKEIEMPDKTPVPLPEIDTEGSMSEVLGSAMDAEMASYEFYNSLSKKFAKNPALERTLIYLAMMEMGHYKLLELEKDTIEKYEDYDTAWPMIHLGP